MYRARRLAWCCASAVAVVLGQPQPATQQPAVQQQATQQAPVTIEQLMSAPFPSELTAAPAGGHVAWVENARGVRNIRVASPPEYNVAAVTAYKVDDGQDITQLAWAPDGSRLVFVRGGAANRRGEFPNPLSDPGGTQQAIWAAPVAGGEPKLIAEGGAPAISSKGQLVFVKQGQIWSAPLDGSGKAEQLVKARGSAGSLRWSPDGSRLAFVSSRESHAFVGVFDPAAKSLRFLDASVDRDSEPVWSPDGKSLAFVREAATALTNLFAPRRAGQPWSVRMADVATGQSKAVFTADAGRGSVFQRVNAPNQILWTSTGHLVFPWERDGWLHLYSVAVAETAAPRLLTYGDFEVEDVRLSADGKEILYSANADDPERRHIFRVAPGGGPATALTAGKGIEWSPAMASDGKALFYLRSDARLPARAAMQQAFGSARDLNPPEFPAAALVEPQAVSYSAADGMRINAQLFVAPGTGRRPAVIFSHGGSRRQMLLGWHYMPYYHHTYAFNQYLASRGYVVLSINYRSGIGYGLDFREALNFGSAGASEFSDVLGAGLYLQSRADVDPKRIGLWGGSYGGYLTALGLARASNLFAAGVDIHGVHDWNVVMRNFRPSYNPLERPREARLAFESSPMGSVKSWKSPVLLIHGDDDRNVPFSESVTLAEALREQGVEFEQLIFPDEVHSFLIHDNWIKAFRAAERFLDKHLRAR